MFEQVVFRYQFLSVLVKRRPGSPDSISGFGRLLLLENSHLAQVSRAFSSCQYFDFYVIDFNFFSCVRALVAENFRLFWMKSRLDRGSPCLVPFLISNMLLSSSVSKDAFWSRYRFFRRLM